MKIEVKFRYKDDPDTLHTVVAGPGAMMLLERQFNAGAAKLGEDQRLEHMLFVAYAQLRHEGRLPDKDTPFDDWAFSIDFEDPSDDVQDGEGPGGPEASPAL
jgi:hypothetical protein